MYNTVIKHNRHLRAQREHRKHKPQASAFCISQVFSNVWGVYHPVIHGFKASSFALDIEVMWQNTIKHAFIHFIL